MNDRRKSTPPNVFSERFLAEFGRRDESPAASEAEHAGPWEVRAVSGGGYGVFREPDSADALPAAILEHREHALVLVAVLPAVGREPLFHLDPTERPEGFAVETVWGDSWTRRIGRIRKFEPEVVEALHLVAALLRSPSALACLLEAAGPTAVKRTGEILAHRLGLGNGSGDD